MRRFTLLVGMLALALLGAWGVLCTPGDAPEGRVGEGETVRGSSTDGEEVGQEVVGTAVELTVANAAAGTERQAVREFSGVVRDAEGRPVVGAVATWTPVRVDVLDVDLPRDMDWDWIRSATRSVRSDADGSFRFEDLQVGSEEGVVWVTHASFQAAFVMQSGDADALGGFRAVELVPRAAAAVRVLHSGAAAPGAVVRHTLDFWSTDLPDEEKVARRFFLREYVADEDGRVQIGLGSRSSRLQAFDGERRSRFWTGDQAASEERGEIELELVDSFRLSGQVFVDVPDFAFEGVRYNVGFYSADDLSDFEWAPGARAVGEDQGRFGPHTWLRPAHTSFHVWVSGGGLIPVGDYFPLPEAGESVQVELQTQVGLELAVEVVDREGSGLDGVKVMAYRFEEDGSLPYAGDARTDERGAATVRGLRAGDYQLSAALDGFQTAEVADERTVLPVADDAPVRIELVPARTLEGFVIHEGEPVHAFTVNAWNDDQSYWNALDVTDEEGRFVFDDAPASEGVFVTAYAEGLPQSDVFPVPPGSTEEIVLDLPVPMEAVGRALDASTLEPVPTATVQPLVSGQAAFLTWRGAPSQVETDGTFVLEGVAPDRGGLSVAAPGYEPLYVNIGPEATDVIEVGDLLLSPERSLHVQVLDDRVTDFTAFRAWNEHVKSQGPVALAADGTCELPSYSLYFVHVRTPDGTLLTEWASVSPGEEPFVVFDLNRGTDVFVSLGSMSEDVEGYSIRAFSPEGNRAQSRGALWDPEARGFLARGLPEGDAMLEVLDTSRAVVARQPVRVEPVELQRVQLAIGGSTWRIRLVDAAGEPYRSRPVDAFVASGGSWSLRTNTDHDGIFEVGPLDAERLVICSKPTSEFCAWGVEVDLPRATEEVVEVELEGAGRCYLRLHEAGRPARGVRVAFTHPRSPYHRPFTYFSDEEGKVNGPEILEGEYTANVVSAQWWRAAHAVHAGPESAPIAIEVYSLGRVVCEVRDARGEPVPGARFQLDHSELGESASRWLAAGRVDADPYSMQTDSSGRLVLDRMPRGEYAWRCQTPEGDVLSGTAELPPAGSVTIDVRSPDR